MNAEVKSGPDPSIEPSNKPKKQRRSWTKVKGPRKLPKWAEDHVMK
ncbi:uncharacterized protein G2W53_020946 [Senna tora]|uniref:Uncharacterized protein n=1 Tax=Senna tora TaxID=362788 RepID=A0A834WHE0_9FABA|nr:uncharacterized protein G2W53_020946 [Senna tora]